MNGAITWDAIAYFVSLGGAIGAVWWFIHSRISKLERDLSDYKLHIAEKYIKSEALEKMEEKLTAQETRTQAALEKLTGRLDTLLDTIVPHIRLSPSKRDS
jgi:phosphoenolpyruvate carboxylase